MPRKTDEREAYNYYVFRQRPKAPERVLASVLWTAGPRSFHLKELWSAAFPDRAYRASAMRKHLRGLRAALQPGWRLVVTVSGCVRLFAPDQEVYFPPDEYLPGRRLQIYQMVKANPGRTSAELAEALNIKPSTLAESLFRVNECLRPYRQRLVKTNGRLCLEEEWDERRHTGRHQAA